MALFDEQHAKPITGSWQFTDSLIGSNDDDILSISTGAGRRWKVNGGRGTNTLKVDFSQVPTSHGIVSTKGYAGGTLTLGTRSAEPEVPYINYAGIQKLEIIGTALDDDFHESSWSTPTDDTIHAGAGNDTLYSFRGVDHLDGGEGIDLVKLRYAGNADATIDSAGTSILPNGTTLKRIERFEVTTGNGNDRITLHGRHDDKITTGAGDDIIHPGLGRDIVSAGNGGNDVLIANYSEASHGIKMHFSLWQNAYKSYSGHLFSSPTDSLRDAKDSINFSSIEQLRITGSAFGDDLRNLSASDDTLIGGAGDDIIGYGGGSDQLDGGADRDTLQLDLQRSSNAISLTSAQEQGAGRIDSNGKTASFENMEKLEANTGRWNDHVNWRGSDDDLISTNAGNDTLISGAGNDTLIGGYGADTLIGVDPDSSTPGLDEIDWLTGIDGKNPIAERREGTDSYRLGDEKNKYYFDGDFVTGISWKEDNDFAIIQDFSRYEDKIVLNGGPTSYYLVENENPSKLPASLQSRQKKTLIIAEKDGQSGLTDKDDVIGVVMDRNGLNLNDEYFEYVGNPKSDTSYDITYVFNDRSIANETQLQQKIVEAIEYWEEIILNDLPDWTDSRNGKITDDLEIKFKVKDLTGDRWATTKILQQRDEDTTGEVDYLGKELSAYDHLPFKAKIVINKNELNQIVSTEAGLDTLKHEIAHAIGFSGKVFDPKGLLHQLDPDADAKKYGFTGTHARQAASQGGEPNWICMADAKADNAAASVSHWDDSAFTGTSELMLERFNPSGPPAGLSSVTLGAFQDLGFQVNSEMADFNGWVAPSDSLC